MLTSFTESNTLACLNLKEDKLKFIFKSSLYSMLKILYGGDEENNKGKSCGGALNRSLIF